MAPSDATHEERLPERRLRRARARPTAPVDQILGRRDVALVPWLSMLAGALAIAGSYWLRGGEADGSIVVAALIGAAVAGAFAAIQDSWLGLRYRGSLWVYLLVSCALLSSLAALAIVDHGLATPAYTGTLLLSAYLGLVFPPVWGRIGLMVLLGAAAGVQIVNPDASLFQAFMVGGLTAAAWVVGVIGKRAHRWTANIASALGSFDSLTGTLNRRGLLRQVDGMVDRNHREAGPIALLVVDLDGFKAVNDQRGHAAGDDLLTWVGETIPSVLPPSAEVGRLGGDEFAVVIPDIGAEEAQQIGRDLRAALAPRIGASVGVATSQNRLVTSHDLFRVADAAMYMCKRDRTLGTHALVAGSAGRIERRRRPRTGDHGGPALSFAEMRAHGFKPEVPETGLMYGWMATQGLLTIAAAGSYVVIHVLLEGPGGGFWQGTLFYLGVPWILTNLALAVYSHRQPLITEGRGFWLILVFGDYLLATGVGVAMLDDGGLAAPIAGALAMKVLFMAAILPRQQALITFGITLAGLLAVAVLGPAGSLWTLPVSLSSLGAAFAMGSICFRALDDLTRTAMDQAHTDELTGLRNRFGFREEAGVALAAAAASGSSLTLLALDLDDFKAINDERGHAGGDLVLREVAGILQEACPTAITIARLGGDEFVALVDTPTELAAAALGREVTVALGATVGASVGHALYPGDATTLDELMQAADRRSYARKRHKRPHPVEERAATRDAPAA